MDQLRNKIRKNRDMVRMAAPITIESTGISALGRRIEEICSKIKKRSKRKNG